MNVQVKPKIHNRFDIWKENVKTGEKKQVGYAENIVLNAMWARLCSGSTYFVNIHYGTGTGTLSAARTSLFTHLGTGGASTVETVKDTPTSHWRRSITLGLATANGAELTEVGIAYGSAASNLVTHAQIRDMNGNVISILKTDVDIITIYATVYVTLVDDHDLLKLVTAFDNGLLSYLLGGSFPAASFYLDAESGGEYTSKVQTSLGSVSGSWINDVANKKRSTTEVRFGTEVGNGHCRDILLSNIARLALPASGIYAGLDIEGVSLGTGDGTTDTFDLPSRNIDESSLVVKADGSPVTVDQIKDKSAVFHYLKKVIRGSRGYDGTSDSTSPVYVDQKCFASKNRQFCIYTAYPYYNECYMYQIHKNGDMARCAMPSNIPNAYTNHHYSVSDDGLVIGFNYLDGDEVLFSSRPTIALDGSFVSVVSGHDISKDGNVVAVIDSTNSDILVFDYVTNAWVQRTEIGASKNYIDVVLSGNGSKVFAREAASSVIDVYTWSSGSWSSDSIDVTYNINRVVCRDDAGIKIAVATQSKCYIAELDGTWQLDEFKDSGATHIDYSLDNTALSHTDGDYRTYGSGRVNYYHKEGGTWVVESDDVDDFIATFADVKLTSEKDSFLCFGRCVSYSQFWSRYNTYIGVFGYRFIPVDKEVVLSTAPADGAVITADYTVLGIHKTDQRVIDISGEIQFGEPT